MLTSEIQLSYRQSTIRIINQPTAVVIHWESKVDGSGGHLQVPSANWTDILHYCHLSPTPARD